MKYKIERINLLGIKEKVYIIQYKKYWFNSWKILLDEVYPIYIPKFFFAKEDCVNFLKF